MNSQKAITLTSLVIYITVVLIVLGILAVISGSFQGNLREIYAEGTNNAEIDKFNVYFLKEVKKQGNEISTISNNEITFALGDKYTFKDNAIYLNDNIKIAENIEKCIFTSNIVNEKTVITVTIKAVNGKEKEIEYVLNSDFYSMSYENEDDYIYNGYDHTEIEYIETTGTQYIDTEYLANNTTKFETKIKIETKPNNIVAIFGGRTSITENTYTIWLNVNGFMRWDYTASSTSQINEGNLVVGDNLVIKDGKRNYINNVELSSNSEWVFNCEYNAFLFGLNNCGNFSNGSSVKMYYAKIYDNNNLIRDYVPVIDKNNIVCLYDKVEGKYYYNKGVEDFIAGPEI